MSSGPGADSETARRRRTHVRSLALAVVAATALLAACSEVVEPFETTGTVFTVPPLPGSPTIPAVAEPPPPLAADRIAAGSEMYGAFCSECHGGDLSGDANWQIPNEDGSFPPPPQDSTGHTWHHPDALLVDIIAIGSEFPQSRMPPFGDQLTEDDILAILDYLKSSWGAQERAFQWEQTLRAQEQG